MIRPTDLPSMLPVCIRPALSMYGNNAPILMHDPVSQSVDTRTGHVSGFDIGRDEI